MGWSFLNLDFVRFKLNFLIKFDGWADETRTPTRQQSVYVSGNCIKALWNLGAKKLIKPDKYYYQNVKEGLADFSLTGLENNNPVFFGIPC